MHITANTECTRSKTENEKQVLVSHLLFAALRVGFIVVFACWRSFCASTVAGAASTHVFGKLIVSDRFVMLEACI